MKKYIKYTDLIGIRYGHLLITGLTEDNPFSPVNERRPCVICKCDCGETTIKMIKYLKSGQTKSCGTGCIFKDVNKNEIFRHYKSRAKQRGLTFDIQKNYFNILISQDCYYCGGSLSNSCSKNPNFPSFKYNGVDRIDSELGYTVKNTVTCCKTCNVSKNNLPLDVWLDWISRVSRRMSI